MGGQTLPAFYPTLVFSMSDEMLDAFDRGLRHHEVVDNFVVRSNGARRNEDKVPINKLEPHFDFRAVKLLFPLPSSSSNL